MIGTPTNTHGHLAQTAAGVAAAAAADGRAAIHTDGTTVRAGLGFADGITWRVSQRGLVVGVPGGAPLLVDHPRAAQIPELVHLATDADDLVTWLGGTPADRQLLDDLLAENVLTDGTPNTVGPPQDKVKRVTFSRSGIEFTGIDAVARRIHRVLMPVLQSWVGRVAVGVILIAGIGCLFLGRPDGPQVSSQPWLDATVGLLLGFALGGLHELGHAVSLVHYGRTPRAAGCGFYWGDLCFYVDCTDGITLPRRARVINALAGLAVDLFTMSVLLILSHTLAGVVLLLSVCWRLAVTQLIGIFENGLPILEVDGHIALSDYLDEPDLSPRSREALSRKLRGGTQGDEPSWLAAYGAFSVIGGVLLLMFSTWIWWLAAGDLVKALFTGSFIEMLLGLYIIVPLAIAAIFSAIGLGLEMLTKPTSTEDAQPDSQQA